MTHYTTCKVSPHESKAYTSRVERLYLTSRTLIPRESNAFTSRVEGFYLTSRRLLPHEVKCNTSRVVFQRVGKREIPGFVNCHNWLRYSLGEVSAWFLKNLQKRAWEENPMRSAIS